MCARSSRRIGQLPPLHSRWPPPPNNAGSPDGGVAGSTPAAPSSRVHARQRGIRSNPLIFPDSGLGKQQVTADRQQLRASARLTAEARSEASKAVVCSCSVPVKPPPYISGSEHRSEHRRADERKRNPPMACAHLAECPRLGRAHPPCCGTRLDCT